MEYEVQPLDLMQFINSKYHECFIHELIEFSGVLNLKKLREAFLLLAEVFPFVKCAYNSQKNVFYLKDLPVEFYIHNHLEEFSPELLTQSLDSEKQLFQIDAGKNFLVITVSHMICDGSGFKNLIYLLFALYNGTAEIPLSLMERDFYQVLNLKKTQFSSILKMLFSMMTGNKNRQIFQNDKTEKSGNLNKQNYVIERTISKDSAEIIRKKAKNHDATMNDVFLCAYSRALKKLLTIKKINIPCTVDLRKYTGSECIANLTGSYSFNISIKKSEKFDITLKRTSKIMKRLKQTENALAGPLLLVQKYESSSLDKFLSLYGNIKTSSFSDFTNLGIFDEKKLFLNDADITSAKFYSGLNKSPFFQIAVSTFKNEITCSSVLNCTLHEKQTAERFLDLFIDEIASF